MKRIGFEVDRVQRIKTDEDDNFRFSKIILLQEKWFRKKLIPIDSETGKQVLQMEHFDETTKRYLAIDVNKIWLCTSALFSNSCDYRITFI